MNYFKAAFFVILSVSVAIMTYKMPNLSNLKIWTYQDEFLLSEELKNIKNPEDRNKITQERKKNAIYLSVSIDGGSSTVFLGDKKVPVAIDGPIRIDGKGPPLDVNASVHLFGGGAPSVKSK